MSNLVLLVIWVGLIVTAVVGMAGLLALVGGGAIGELRQSLHELREGGTVSEDSGSNEDAGGS